MKEYAENWVAEPTSPLGVLAVQYTPVHSSLDPPRLHDGVTELQAIDD